MNLSADIIKTIIPVQSGTTKGTAFFAAPGCFITARHVVTDALRHNHKVELTYKGAKYQGDAQGVDGKDIAIILCPSLVLKMASEIKHYAPLVAIPCENLINEEFTICGYPNEIGNSVDKLTIIVKGEFRVTKRGYDIVTSRVGNYQFSHYDGFSGSPVINKKGAIVGVAVVQVANQLAFVSTEQIAKKANAIDLEIENSYQSYDTSAVGKSICEELLEHAKLLAGKRYFPNLHVASPSFEKKINDFLSYSAAEHRTHRMSEIEQHILGLINSKTIGAEGEEYKDGDYANLSNALEKWQNDTRNISKRRELEYYRRILEKFYDGYVLSMSQVAVIIGTAGTGKTHMSCHIADKVIKKQHVYLLLGSQFNGQKDCWEQFLDLLKLTSDKLAQLNENCKQDKKNALIIIDALNEGAGERYWKIQLPILLKQMKNYENIKLLLTIRAPFDREILSGIDRQKYPIIYKSGYSDIKVREAMERYFMEYGVDPVYGKQYFHEFKNPLFLYIFCVAYKNMSAEEKKNYIGYVRLFELYLKDCNRAVSDKVDEDELRNITSEAMKEIATSSVVDYHGNQVPRQTARKITDGICPNRLWHQHLLKVLLDEDLLMDSKDTLSEDDMIMFGFEKMEDFLKADSLVHSKKSNNDIFDLLSESWHFYEQNPDISRSKFDNMMAAIIAIWDRENALMSEPRFAEEYFTINLEDALNYEKEPNVIILRKWLNSRKDMMDAETNVHRIAKTSENELNIWHANMSKMSIVERDGKWTVGVNKFFNTDTHYAYLQQLTQEPIPDEKLLTVLTWMLTTSFPQAHHFLSKLLMKQFRVDDRHIYKLLSRFKGINDNYIHHGLLEAIYGVLLQSRNVKLHLTIGDAVIKTYISKNNHTRKDLLLRYWLLKITDRVYYISGDVKYRIKPNFGSELCRSPKQMVDKTVFMNRPGMARLYYTLSKDSDFHKYVLRSNWGEYNKEFRAIGKEGKLEPIAIEQIAETIKSIVLDKYKLQLKADMFDASFIQDGRMDNKKERIGKKYAWLALYEVYAGMCDQYTIKLPSFNMSIDDAWTDKCYPWYTNIFPNVDPTLLSAQDESNFALEPKQIVATDAPVLCARDQNGDEWVCLMSYEKKTEDETEIRFFVNGLFAKNEDGAFDKWGAKTDFTGRWLPESSDCYQCVWNEYPWADAYQQNKGIENAQQKNIPGEVAVSFASLLQEETIGLINDFGWHNVWAPSEEIMRELKLYTAERGMVRSEEDNQIVAINGKNTTMGHESLFIKKKLLLRFMRKHHYSLYHCTLATRSVMSKDDTISFVLPDLSGCWRMTEAGNWKELQALSVPHEELI